MSCTDCTCKTEDCKHETVYYCDCCKGVHCFDCDEKWENHTDWRDFWHNAEDLTGPTHTFPDKSVIIPSLDKEPHIKSKDCFDSRRNDHCMKPGERDWNPT